MFETVAPETFQTRSRRLFYETLPVSIAIHALAIAGCVAAALWTVVFPEASPRVSVSYSLTKIPDPPPPPPPPDPPKPQFVKAPVLMKSVPPPPPPMLLGQEAAPTVIPDRIPIVIEPPPMPQPKLVKLDMPVGNPNGVEGGSLAGDLMGKLHGTPGGIVFPDGRLHIDINDKVPMAPIEQDYPYYPHDMQKKGIEDTVILQYVIGTDGRVNQVDILEHASDTSFDEAAVDAIKRWRFHPMVKDGKRIEVVHQIAVNFQLVRH